MTLPAFLAAVVLAVAAQAAPAGAADECRTVHVVDHGYHTGLIVPASAFDPAASLGTTAYAEAEWLEFGWGDAEFYQAKNPGFAMAVSALLNSEGAVLHVLGLPVPPSDAFPKAGMVTLRVTEAGLSRMLDRIRGTFMRAADGSPILTGTSYGGQGRFFRAYGDYSLSYTCNHWMADLLIAGGVRIDPAGTAFSSDLMAKLAEAGPVPCVSPE